MTPTPDICAELNLSAAECMTAGQDGSPAGLLLAALLGAVAYALVVHMRRH